MTENIAKPTISTVTMVAPTGVPAKMEIINPAAAHTTEKMAAHTVTEKKLLNNRIAERAGKMTKAEINSEPTRFMAKTITTAIKTAIKRL